MRVIPSHRQPQTCATNVCYTRSMFLRLWLVIVDRLFPRRCRRIRRVVIEQSGSSSPAEVTPCDAVLVRGGSRNKWLRFDCPNRCGITIALNLSPSRRPFWHVSIGRDGTLSVHPSVVHESCGAHFWIHDNRIKWV